MDHPEIPSISIDSEFQQISDAIASLGFLFLQSPPVPTPQQVDNMFETSRRFFKEESQEEKAKVGVTVGNVGWVQVRQESLDAQGNPQGDIKEAFNMKPFTASDGAKQPLPPILKADEKFIGEFMKSCHDLCMKLLEAFALTLKLPKDFFTSKHSLDRPQGSILRLLYYPETDLREPNTDQQNDIRAGAHSDYGSLTLLFQKDVGGLQILLPSTALAPSAFTPVPLESQPQWLDAPVSKSDSVLVNIGDLMEFWTGGRFPSTVHRVSLPRTREEATDRFSIAYFLHPDDDVLLERLTEDGDDVNARLKARFGVDPNVPLTARQWLESRLAATYSGRKES